MTFENYVFKHRPSSQGFFKYYLLIGIASYITHLGKELRIAKFSRPPVKGINKYAVYREVVTFTGTS